MSVFQGPLRWYGFKVFASKEEAEMHQALLAMEGVYTVIMTLRGKIILYPATEQQIKDLNAQIDGAK